MKLIGWEVSAADEQRFRLIADAQFTDTARTLTETDDLRQGIAVANLRIVAQYPIPSATIGRAQTLEDVVDILECGVELLDLLMLQHGSELPVERVAKQRKQQQCHGRKHHGLAHGDRADSVH